jgi:hypothetical protein
MSIWKPAAALAAALGTLAISLPVTAASAAWDPSSQVATVIGPTIRGAVVTVGIGAGNQVTGAAPQAISNLSNVAGTYAIAPYAIAPYAIAPYAFGSWWGW